MEPTIQDGVIVWVYKTVNIEDGQIGIFMLDGAAACKRLSKRSDGRIYLVSDNPDQDRYPPISIGEFQELCPVGRVLMYK